MVETLLVTDKLDSKSEDYLALLVLKAVVKHVQTRPGISLYFYFP